MSEWQPIESAPMNERFLAYRPRVQGPCVVFRWGAGAPLVVEPETGKTWAAEWWMPLPPPPPQEPAP